jgi:hypothetical protein
VAGAGFLTDAYDVGFEKFTYLPTEMANVYTDLRSEYSSSYARYSILGRQYSRAV